MVNRSIADAGEQYGKSSQIPDSERGQHSEPFHGQSISTYDSIKTISQMMSPSTIETLRSALVSTHLAFPQELTTVTNKFASHMISDTQPVINNFLNLYNENLLLNMSKLVDVLDDFVGEMRKSFSLVLANLPTGNTGFKPWVDLLRQYPRSNYPSNIKAAAAEVRFSRIYEIEYDDGIALFDVLRASLVSRLIKADTTRKRRAILSQAYDQILFDCKAYVNKAVDNSFSRKKQGEVWLASLVLEAISVLEKRNFAAGQSLLCVILGNLLAEHLGFPWRDYINYKNKVKKTSPLKIREEQDFRTVLAFLPVFSAWQHFDGVSDSSPVEFSRHAIMHRPAKRQFSKTNASQGLLCVTSLMAYCFDWDLHG